MRRYRLPICLALALSFFIFLIIRCGDIATDPFSADKAKVTLFLISSDFTQSDTAITDTVGKKMRLGVCLYLTQHIDSTVITIGKNITSLDTAITCVKKDRPIDTVYYMLSFPAAGDRTVTATGYLGKNLRPAASATVHVLARSAPNHKPELSISGNQDIIAGQTCTLEATADDPDSGQTISINAAEKPEDATFDGHTFSWSTTTADTGDNSIVFIATDNGSPVLSDIDTVTITVTAPTVTTAPRITEQPSSLAKCPGDSVTLTVIATGAAPLSYQWKKGASNVGANSPSLTINPVASASAGNYTVIVSNIAGSDTSADALLSVNTVSSKPTITPASPATCPNVPLTLHLSGGTLGTGASWKWYTGSCGETLVGSDSTLTVNPSVNTVYFVRAEGGCQTTDCSFAEVTINTVPKVTTQPVSQALWVGDSATFSIAATGTATLTYQWYRGATAVGTNSPSLKIKPIVFADSGNYSCIVTNNCGKDTSEVGRLTVNPVYTVTFNSNGGSVVPSQTVKSDSMAKKPTNPTKSGYTFAEWYSDTALTAQFNFSTPITAAKTLYAKWVVMDIDGNIYTTVTIGTQTWMVENLKTTRFNDGSAIPLVADSAAWASLSTPAYCWYNNDSIYKSNNYGALYNWYSVNTGKLAPNGWHVPDTTEWNTLQDYLIANGFNYDGTTIDNKIAKSLAAKTDWAPSTGLGDVGNDLSKNNKSGFTTHPCGHRFWRATFYDLGISDTWWSATAYDGISACDRAIFNSSYWLYSGQYHKNNGFSVRCILNK
jgi:uncharacterized protein (TIGR02145 family)/uncharacterized repeat protein (TIGR02543 family)